MAAATDGLGRCSEALVWDLSKAASWNAVFIVPYVPGPPLSTGDVCERPICASSLGGCAYFVEPGKGSWVQGSAVSDRPVLACPPGKFGLGWSTDFLRRSVLVVLDRDRSWRRPASATDACGECFLTLPLLAGRMKSSRLLLEAGFLLCPRLLLVSNGPGEIAFNLSRTSSPPTRFGLSGANRPNVSCSG